MVLPGAAVLVVVSAAARRRQRGPQTAAPRAGSAQLLDAGAAPARLAVRTAVRGGGTGAVAPSPDAGQAGVSVCWPLGAERPGESQSAADADSRDAGQDAEEPARRQSHKSRSRCPSHQL